MLGASQAVLLGTASAAVTYDDLVDLFDFPPDPSVVSYWKFQNDGSDKKGTRSASITGSPELNIETIVQLDTVAEGAPVDGNCIAWPGTPGVFAEASHHDDHKTPEGTIVVTFQHDSLAQKSTLVAADRSAGGTSSGPGGLSMEITSAGAPRCYLRRQSDGLAVELIGQAGDVQLNQAYTLIFKWGPPDGLSMALWNASGSLVRDTRETNPLTDPVTGTSPIRFGLWHDGLQSAHDGPFGRVIWLKRRITDGEEEILARARTIFRSTIPANVFRVDDFGGIGNGVANDRSAILAAMDAAAAATPKGIVWFSAGKTYRVVQSAFGTASNILPVLDITAARAGITLASDPNNRARIKLRDDPPGGGSGTELHTPLIQLSNTSNVTIRDIIIDGSRAAYWDGPTSAVTPSAAENGAMHCIRVVGGSGHQILGKVNITHAHADGLYVRDGASITVDGGANKDVVIEWSRRNGCSPVNCDGLTMRNFKFQNSGKTIGVNQGQAPQANFDCEPNNNNVAKNILLEDFESRDAAGRGFMIDVRTGGRGCQNCTVRRGIFRGNGSESVRLRTTADNAALISNITFEDLDCDTDGPISIGGTTTPINGHANNVTVTDCILASNRQIVIANQDGDGWNITGNTRVGSSDVVSQNNVSLTNSTVQP